jgi:hypothetical protein
MYYSVQVFHNVFISENSISKCSVEGSLAPTEHHTEGRGEVEYGAG